MLKDKLLITQNKTHLITSFKNDDLARNLVKYEYKNSRYVRNSQDVMRKFEVDPIKLKLIKQGIPSNTIKPHKIKTTKYMNYNFK